jgi:hypothetical protein
MNALVFAIPVNGYPPLVWARMVAHEGFHWFFQIPYGFTAPEVPSHSDMTVCANQSSLWSDAINRELDAWADILPTLATKTDREVADFAHGRIQARHDVLSKADPLATRCLADTLRFERVEGVARYFDEEAAMRGGVLSNAEMLREDLSYARDPARLEAFYYATGAWWSRILLRLDPTDAWQVRVEQGESPQSVAESLI